MKLLLLLEWLLFASLSIYSVIQFTQFSIKYRKSHNSGHLKKANDLELAAIVQIHASLFLALGSQDVILFAGTCLLPIILLLFFARNYYEDWAYHLLFGGKHV